MPVRFMIDGVQYETDTAEEAVYLQRALKAPPRPSSRILRAHGRPRPGYIPVMPPATPAPEPTSEVSAAHAIFRNGHYSAFERLYAAGDDGVQTAELAKAAGLKGPKSLPPTLAAWRARAKAAGINLNSYLKVERAFSNGEARTVYRLNAEGKRVLSETARVAVTTTGR